MSVGSAPACAAPASVGPSPCTPDALHPAGAPRAPQADKERRAKKKEKQKKRKEEEIRKKSTPPTEWFKVFRGNEFSKYEEGTGIPTHDAKDKEISESIRNKLKKEWNKQKEVYEKYMLE